MSKVTYTETAWFEMRPNIYGGKNCDEHVPQWNGYVAGDKQDDTCKDPLIFDPKDYPPGTKIIVSEPVCPKCDEVYENCMVRGEEAACNFDWTNWAEDQFN